jgi:hypothetical protein
MLLLAVRWFCSKKVSGRCAGPMPVCIFPVTVCNVRVPVCIAPVTVCIVKGVVCIFGLGPITMLTEGSFLRGPFDPLCYKDDIIPMMVILN